MTKRMRTKKDLPVVAELLKGKSSGSDLSELTSPGKKKPKSLFRISDFARSSFLGDVPPTKDFHCRMNDRWPPTTENDQNAGLAKNTHVPLAFPNRGLVYLVKVPLDKWHISITNEARAARE